MDQEVTVEQIQKATCKYFKVTLGDLKSKRRSTDIVFPRQAAILPQAHLPSFFLNWL